MVEEVVLRWEKFSKVAKGCVRFGLTWSGQYIKMAMGRWIFKYNLSHC